MEITEQIGRLAREATARGGLPFGKAVVLRNLRHCLRAGTKRLSQGQGHHTIDRQEERGVGRGSGRGSAIKGQKVAAIRSARRTLELFQGERWGQPLRDGGWSAYGLSPAPKYHLELN